MTCPICRKPYTRGLDEHTGPSGCLDRTLEFLSMEFPGFTLVSKLDDGTPFVLASEGKKGASTAVDMLQTFIASE